jgi:membrane fusion protein, adhesin transport system
MLKDKIIHVFNKMTTRRSKHLSKSVLLEETGTSRIMRITLVFLAILLALFLGWSNATKLDEVAVAEGQVVPSSQVRKIQHPIGGVVSKIAIEEGIFIEKGQSLIWLTSAEDEARLAVRIIQKNSLQARRERLNYFVSQIIKNVDSLNLKNIRLTAYHQVILEDLKDFEKIEGEILTSQIEQLKNELGVLAMEEERLITRKNSLEKELAARNILVLKGEALKISLLNLRREIQDVDNELSQVPLKCYKLFVDNQKNSLSEISSIDNELAQLEKQISGFKDNLRQSRIVAPVTGIVHNLTAQSEGEVVPAGKTIFEIIPRGNDLIAEVRVLPKDIGHISVDQKVILKFTAYEVSSYGGMEGVLARISPSTFLDPNGQPYYKAIVRLEKPYLGDNPKQNLILPGMTLEADIRTGSKTILQYLLKPIFKSGQQALRER